MTKGATTRDAIISEALAQAVVAGLDGLSIGGLSGPLSMSKSGLFAHFRSRESLQLAVLDRAAERFADTVIRPALAAPGGALRLRALFIGYLGWIRDGAGAGGCLFVSAAQEFDDRPGPIRDRLVAVLTDWREVVRRVVMGAVARGDLPPETDVEQVVFEFIGLALSFQQSSRLMGEANAEARALAGLARLVPAAGSPGRDGRAQR